MNAQPTISRFSISSILVFGAAVGLLGVVLGATPLGWNLEQNYGLKLLFESRGPRVPPPGAVVLAIDESVTSPFARASREDAEDNAGDPWNRGKLSELVDLLVELNVSVIAINLFFKESGSRDEDEMIKASIERAGNVVLFQDLVRERGRYVAIDPLTAFRERSAALGSFVVPTLPSRADFFWPVFPVDESRTANGEASDSPQAMGRGLSISLPVAALHLHTRRFAETAELPYAGKSVAGSPRATLSRFRTEAEALLEETRRSNGPPANDSFLDRVEARDAVLATRLREAYRSPGVRYLNYYGPAATIPTVSYRDLESAVQAGSLDRFEWLAGNAVFVGYFPTVAAAQVGRYETVYIGPDGLDLSGVEIAATAYLNLRHGETLKRALPIHRTLLTFVAGFVMGILVLGFRPLKAIISALVFAVTCFVLVAWQFFANAAWLPVVIPFGIQLPVATFWGMVWQYLRARKEGAIYRQGLEGYVPQSALAQLEKRGAVAAQSEKVYATCLFADIADYTPLSESIEASELTGLVNDYFSRLSDSVTAHGGEVFSAQGDEILAVWSAAGGDSAPRAKACACALAMVERIAEFNRVHEEHAIFTRLGMHAGWVERGIVGGGGHFSYSVVGDIVNTGKRIESLNKPLGTQILATREVVDGLDDFLTRPVGSFIVKGKTQPLEVFQILGWRSQATERQEELCEAFDQAVSAFRENNYEKAQEYLAAASRAVSDDGPISYYRSIIDGTRKPVIQAGGAIVLEEK